MNPFLLGILAGIAGTLVMDVMNHLLSCLANHTFFGIGMAVVSALL